MRSARVLIGLLVLATVAVDLVVFEAFREVGLLHGGLANPRVVLLGALAFSQTGMLAVLVALGRPGSPWPWTGLFVGVVCEAQLLCVMHGVGPAKLLAYGGFLLFQVAAVLAGLALPRRWGHVLRHASIAAPAPDVPKRPIQFSLARLFGWMSAVAICLSLAQVVLARTLDVSLMHQWMVEAVSLALASALVTLAAAWAVLGRQKAAVGCGVAALAVPVAATIAWLGGPTRAAHWGLYFALCFTTLALLLASLAVVRLAGYRFERTK